MKLALFSQNITEKHKEKLKSFFSKPLEEVRFLYINTPGNYKPYKSDWMIEGENRWRNIFPNFQEFDLERAYRIDSNFDFNAFFSNYDFIFSSGGNTFILSYWLKKTGALEIIRDLVMENEIVYGGESAGSVIASHDISWADIADDPLKAPERVNKGFGFVDFAPIPHWNNPEFQNELQKIKDRLIKNGIKTVEFSDQQAIFIEDGKIEIT